MNILGINAFHGDASAALFSGGQLVAASEEERFNRIKHWAGFPASAARCCLQHIDLGELTHIAISRDPRSQLWRKVCRVSLRPGDWGRLVSRARNSVKVARIANALDSFGISLPDKVRLYHIEHHRAHLASAFFASPFEEAAVVSIDGFGDFSSVMWGLGGGNNIQVKGGVPFPHSLGVFYTAFTQFLGFPKYGDEYKMMGLSAFGRPRFVDQVRKIVRIEKDRVILDLDYFIHHTEGVEMTWDNCEPTLGNVYSSKMIETFGQPRPYRSEIEQTHVDLAASVQVVLEENYLALLNHVQKVTKQKTVCLAGGVALNCVANGMIFERTAFTNVYIQPAAHDAGTSIGAALYVQHQILNQPRTFVMRHVNYGPEYTTTEIRAALDEVGCSYHELPEIELIQRAVQQLQQGRIVGWFQGRMEFGPRALGNRSILADPRRNDMKDILNARIKYREPFRPFCPSVLSESASEFFETDYPSPFMVMAYKIKPHMRQVIPAVTHSDGTGRLQTVEREVTPLYWKLIRSFGDATGVPVLLNTSFNENEPIVDTPAQAIDCFLRTRMDILAIGSFFLLKTENAHRSVGRTVFATTV